MFSAAIRLAISPESLHRYKEVAHKHLHEHNSTVGVAVAGADEDGNKIFGIRLVSDEGEEEWYEPESESYLTSEEQELSSLLGWDNEQDAYIELENKVLPQLGYALIQKDLQQFHRSMGELDEET
jgi:hypothetical protein